MNKLFILASAAVVFGTGVVGCGNTTDGAAKDVSNDTAAVAKAGAMAADKTVKGTEAAGAAVEKGAANAGAAVEKGAADAGAAVANGAAAVEKGAVNAGAAVEKGVANAGATVEKGAADAGMAVKHGAKTVTIVPTVKAALLKDETLYPSGNAALNKINVDMGSDGQTLMLKGTVQTNDMKKLAGEIAKKASPDGGYKIDNQLTVEKH